MIEWIKSLCIDTAHFNSILGICLYWVPVSLCVVGYTLRTARNLRTDVIKRKEFEDNLCKDTPLHLYYTPTDTIGSLIGRAFVSLMPVANIWAAMFDVAPEMFGKLFKWIELVFNQPLVPRKEDKPDER